MKKAYTFDTNSNIIDANGNVIVSAAQVSSVQASLVPSNNVTPEQIVSAIQHSQAAQGNNQSIYSVDDNKQRLMSKLFSISMIALGTSQLLVGALLEKNILSVIYNVNTNSTSSGVFLTIMAFLLIAKGVVGLKKTLAGFEVNFWVNLLDIVIFGLIAITNVGVNNVSDGVKEAAQVTQESVEGQYQRVTQAAALIISDAARSKDWMDGLRTEAKMQYGISKGTDSYAGYKRTGKSLTQKGYSWCNTKYNNQTLDTNGFLNCATGFVWKNAS